MQVPYRRFRQKMKSRCALYGLWFDDTHLKADTPKVHAFTLDPIRKPSYGKTWWIQRGLHRSARETPINAGVNGTLNHARRAAGDSVVSRMIGRGRANRPA